jgi:hypothetical protein
MKTITIIVAMLFCFGCATPPQHPRYPDVGLGITMEQEMQGHKTFWKEMAEYKKARAEYEQTASFKSLPYLLMPLLLLGGAANGILYGGAPRYGSIYGTGGYGYSGTPVVVTNPTGCK